MSTYAVPGVEDVTSMVNEVWASFVGPDPLLPSAPIAHDACWSAAVSVTGEWPGMITMTLSPAAATSITAHMLATQAVTDADIADAVGELVNMIGGNVKSLMPEPSLLSLPMVAAGRIAVPSDTTEVARLDLLWHGEPVSLRVHTFDNTWSTP